MSTDQCSNSTPTGKHLLLKYIGSYLLGILLCLLLTSVEIQLAGVTLLPVYALAFIGYFLYYFYLSPQYVFGPESTYWLVGSIGWIPILMEIVLRISKNENFRSWRPLWIGVPIGFIGTLGVYFTAAASI